MRKIIFFATILILLPLYKLSAQEDAYPAGSLLALNEKGAAVYYIGEDGAKYIFPDDKTYFTWHDDFSNVEKVDIGELDEYPDGGVMPYKPSTKLITHANTVNVYAVEPNGVLRRIPSAEIAEELYGDNWGSMVQDIIPGYFSSSYTLGVDLSDKLPTGTLVKEEDEDDIYYIDSGIKKKFLDNTVFESNNLKAKDIMTIADASQYPDGISIKDKEELSLNFNKDQMFKYSDYELSYSVTYQPNMTTVVFKGAISTNLEIRKAVVYGIGPMKFNYNGNHYFTQTEGNYFEYLGDPIVINNFNQGLMITGGNTNSWLGSGMSNITTDLKDWIIWDKDQDKRVVNIHSQTTLIRPQF